MQTQTQTTYFFLSSLAGRTGSSGTTTRSVGIAVMLNLNSYLSAEFSMVKVRDLWLLSVTAPNCSSRAGLMWYLQCHAFTHYTALNSPILLAVVVAIICTMWQIFIIILTRVSPLPTGIGEWRPCRLWECGSQPLVTPVSLCRFGD